MISRAFFNRVCHVKSFFYVFAGVMVLSAVAKRRMMDFSSVASQCEERGLGTSMALIRVPDFEITNTIVPARTISLKAKLQVACSGVLRSISTPFELRAISPDTVKNDSHLSSDSYLCLFCPDSFREFCSPAFERRATTNYF